VRSLLQRRRVLIANRQQPATSACHGVTFVQSLGRATALLRENEVKWDWYRSLTLKVGESSRIQAVRIEYVEVAAVGANRRRREQ
jgi:hypothetical protein